MSPIIIPENAVRQQHPQNNIMSSSNNNIDNTTTAKTESEHYSKPLDTSNFISVPSHSRPETASSSSVSTPLTLHTADHLINTQDIPGISTFDSTFPQPNSIRINVEGAFIVDEDESNGRQTPPGTRDIVLPHHNSEVSHIAVDVRI